MAKDINWKKTYAAVWRGKKGRLRAVSDLDTIAMDDLLGIDTQKAEFRQNLEQFLDGRPRNHVLLWGARGTGKSSLVKAALNTYGDQKLRVVEVEKQDIDDLPEISDLLRELPWRFLLYCDDLTFEAGDPRYRYLKVLMEGSIERPPENILMMATSNRRHLVSEKMQDNLAATLGPNGEIHHGDTVEESTSLADRFGLRLSFYAPPQDQYLQMVDRLFTDYAGDREMLHREAINFATARGGRSGRVAKQFYNYFVTQISGSDNEG
ncbi:ATPase [Thiomicrospira sp. XS5]|uniref:ATP-binding protein n=1 Tax=Thiomicrospira sp. XS5 TaxID=1775636 RepID=UPI0007460E02|nr:ATP-binding protein [Thiomicrospira sp. XS5]KUJ73517.1 ATPase [Thiomicrospira sp. XS5]